LWLCEGEPDAVRAWSLGLAAVGVPGAGNWRTEWAPRFTARRVVVCFDGDEAGRSGARRAAQDLANAGIDARIVDLHPSTSDGSDLTEFVAAAATDAGRMAQARTLLNSLAEAAEPVLAALPKAPTGERRGNEPRAKRPARTAHAWAPPKLDEAALYGLAGKYCEFVRPYTEASTPGILASLVVSFGSAVGGNAFVEVGATTHRPNEYVLLVGPTATGRKGDTINIGLRPMRLADPDWADRIRGGFGSGEAIVHEIRDADGEDEGAADKRLLIKEGEVALPFQVAQRQGSTLSSMWRNAWDGGTLENRTKGKTIVARDGHVSVLAAVSPDELLRLVGATELANGFLNRFILIAVRRHQLLPRPKRIPGAVEDEFVGAFTEALAFARSVDALTFDEHAGREWDRGYETVLSVDRPGLWGAACSRAEAHTLRLAMLFALLDKSRMIRVEHVRAALALWSYGEQSAVLIFGDRVGNPTADAILAALREDEDGLTRDQIRNLFARHRSREEIDLALGQLAALGAIECEKRATGGRPETRYCITSERAPA
jgi:hypothetical protein